MKNNIFFVEENIFYIGTDDSEIDLFEGQYRTDGMCYNSYLIKDEKVCVFDGVDARFGEVWLENIDEVLCGGEVDYLIVQHMEPDHSASIFRFAERYPEISVDIAFTSGRGQVLAMNEERYDFHFAVKE